MNTYALFTAPDKSYRFQYPTDGWTPPAMAASGAVGLRSSNPAIFAMAFVEQYPAGSLGLLGFRDRWYQGKALSDLRILPHAGGDRHGIALSGINAMQETFVASHAGPSGAAMFWHKVVLCVPPNNRKDAFALWMFTSDTREPVAAEEDFDRMVSSFQLLIPGTDLPDTRPAQLTSRKAGIILTFPGHWEKCNLTGSDASLRIWSRQAEQNGENMQIAHVPGPFNSMDELVAVVAQKTHPLLNALVLSQRPATVAGEPGLLRTVAYHYNGDGVDRRAMEVIVLHGGNGLLICYEAPSATFDAYIADVAQVLNTIQFTR